MGNGESGGDRGDRRDHDGGRFTFGGGGSMSSKSGGGILQDNHERERERETNSSKTSQGNQGKGSGIDQNKSSKATPQRNQGKEPGIYQNEPGPIHNQYVDETIGVIAHGVISTVASLPLNGFGKCLGAAVTLGMVNQFAATNEKTGHVIVEVFEKAGARDIGGGNGQTVEHGDGSKTIIRHGLPGEDSTVIKVSKDGKKWDYCP